MKRYLWIMASILMVLGCSNESNEFMYQNPTDNSVANQPSESVKQDDNTQQNNAHPVDKTRSLSIMLEGSGIVDITCTYDESNEEHCSGVYRETGAAVSHDIVRLLVETPNIDKKIEESLVDGCENKKLILNCDLRDEYPEFARPAGSWDNPDAKAYDQKKLESRNKALDQFIAENPGIASEGSVNSYRESTYSTLELTMDACNYKAFIQKNKYKIYILEFSGLVSMPDPNNASCNNSVNYAILYEGAFSQGKENAKPQHLVFNDEASFHKYLDDMKANMYEADGFDFDQWIAPYKAISNKIDFSKDQMVVFEGGQSGTGSVRMMVMEACDDKMEVDVTMCAGKPADTSLAWPAMFVRMPKGQYEFSQGNSGLVCDDNYEPMAGQVPEQVMASIDEGAFCEYPIAYTVLEKSNLNGGGSEDEEAYWNKQNATVMEDMDSLKSYLDSLRGRHIGEYIDGIDNSTHYVFDGYVEKYADFDFSQNIMVAFEGGHQPSIGYDMRIEPVCSTIVKFNVTHCTNPEISGPADIGYPFILASFPRPKYEGYEFVGGSIGVTCKIRE